MKIAHLTTVDLSLRYLLLPQLLAARDAGHEVLGISAAGPWVADLEAVGIRHVPLRASTRTFDLRADWAAARELRAILRRERPDVLHTHNPKPGIYGRVVGRWCRVPIVVNTVHGLYATPEDPLPRRAAVYLLEGLAARCSDAELVQNPEDLALLARWHLSPRAELLGNGVDLDRFAPGRIDATERRVRRDEWSAGDDDVVIGCVARLVAEKGLTELLGAAEQLDPRCVVVVVGGHDPAKPDALGLEALERGRRAGVRFLGHRDDVDRLYGAMDLFVLPSHREGFPRAAMEAAASGLPVVATDERGCRQVVETGRTGLLVPIGDVDSLTRALASLAADPDRRAVMGVAARRRAEERFDERAVIATVLHTYERLAAARDARPGGGRRPPG